MWMLTNFGAFSTTLRDARDLKNGDERQLQVRARRAKHLAELKRRYLANASDVVRLRHRDYEYRTVYRVKHPDREGPKSHWGIFGSSLAYLLECDWCVSVWVSGGLVTGLTYFISVPMPMLIWLAASTVTGLIATHEPD